MATIDTGTQQILCDVTDRVATITLNRPEARNALSDELTTALRRMIAERGADPNVGAILLTGAGGAFCSGGDVKGMANRDKSTRSSETMEQMKARHHEIAGALHQLRIPTIAAIPGAAAGAGLAIALSCDMRIAADNAFVATGYAKIGLSGDYGVAWLLTRTIGPARARELLLTAERVDAARAADIGLFNRVVPADELMAAATAQAKTLANGPTVAFGSIKDNLDDALVVDHATAIEREAERLVQCRKTADHKEAATAFVEKRRPEFVGR